MKLDAIEFTMVPSRATAYQMLQTGQLDIVTPPPELTGRLLAEKKAQVFPEARTYFIRFNNKVAPFTNVNIRKAFYIVTPPPELTGRLLAEKKAQVFPEARTYFIRFNNKVAPFTNVNIRKAFSLALNRDAYTRVLLQGGQIPLRGFIPHGLSSGTGEFRKQAGGLYKDNDAARAREHLQAGLKELGLTALPEITMRASAREDLRKIAQAVQAQWKQALKVQVNIEVMEPRA